jgi:hypothetical protein
MCFCIKYNFKTVIKTFNMFPNLSPLSFNRVSIDTNPPKQVKSRKLGIFARAWLFKNFGEFLSNKSTIAGPFPQWNEISATKNSEFRSLLDKAKEHARRLFDSVCDIVDKGTAKQGEDAKRLAMSVINQYPSSVGDALTALLEGTYNDSIELSNKLRQAVEKSSNSSNAAGCSSDMQVEDTYNTSLFSPPGELMPEFRGPPIGIRTNGDEPDGLDVWCYIRQKNKMFSTPIKSGDEVLSPLFDKPYIYTYNIVTDPILKTTYEQYVEKFVQYDEELMKQLGWKDNEQEDNLVTYDYTINPGSFNRPLRVEIEDEETTLSNVKYMKENERLALGDKIRLKIQATHGKQHFDTTSTIDIFKSTSLSMIHKMWRLIYCAPRAPQDFVFVRSVINNDMHLMPGGPQKEVGMKYFEPSFISVTSAPIGAYFDGDYNLSRFFTQGKKCCIMVLVVKKDTPMLSLGFNPFASFYGDEEQETILAPCTFWRYEGPKTKNIDEDEITVYRYTVTSLFS